jgi:hypothetical protein
MIMGTTVLRDVLMGWDKYERDGVIYLSARAEPSLDTAVTVLPFDPGRSRRLEGQEGFLGIEQLRDVIEGLEAQLGRTATASERLRAAIHYARHDAFIEPAAAVDG